MTLAPGTRLGTYEVLSPLGAGGMGEVYRARDSKLKRDVAIKVLPESLAANPEALARFEREALAVAALSHPNILSIFDFGAQDGVSYAVMELLEGETLRERLDAGLIPQKQVVDYALQAARGLAAAHEKGIVHRDLKPENLFITRDGHLKILDFGLAKRTEKAEKGTETSAPTDLKQTGPGVVMGTMGYMSPEQVRGLPLDHRSDIFSFGAVLYEMLSGKQAFKRDTASDTIAAIMRDEPPNLSDSGRAISPALDHVVQLCLEKDQDNRLQTAREIALVLSKASLVTGTGDIRLVAPPAAPPSAKRKVHAAVTALVVLAAGGLFLLWRTYRGGAEGGGVKRLAVLPFTDMSADKNQEYFSDGLTEELLNVLALNPKLRVTSRTSAFSFKGKNVDIRTIARKLNVAYVVEGSVRRAADDLRIKAELIDVTTDSPLWTQTYDRKMDNIFAVQDEIASSVAGALKSTLEGGRPPATRQVNTEAYNAYLQGNFFFNRKSKEDLEKACDYYERALRIDPRYARAWAGLSAANMEQANRGYVPVDEGFGKARKEVEKALELDPNLAAAYLFRSGIRIVYDWDWNGADSDCRRALELEPGNASVLRGAARLAATLGRFDQAIGLERRALELDPLPTAAHFNLGLHFLYAGRWQEAESSFRKALELNPQDPNAHCSLGRSYLGRSRPEEALAEMLKEREPAYRGYGLALAYYAAGKKKEADSELADYIEKFHKEWAFQIAEIYAYRSETDKAFEWLERAYTQRDGGLSEIKGEPDLRGIKRDPRWPAFLKKMKLPPD